MQELNTYRVTGYRPVVGNRVEYFRASSESQVLSYIKACLLYTSPSPRDVEESRMPSSA